MPLTLRPVILAAVACAVAAAGCGGQSETAEAPPRASARRTPAILPVFLLDLGGKAVGEDDEVRGTLTVVETHDGSLAGLADLPAALRSPVVLELHGETSRTLAKKSYQLELVDDRDDGRDLPLLGLPAGSDWVLHSCGFDPTCMRNTLAFELARQMGHYAPRTRFIELFVDGSHDGLYVLVERIRRDAARVDLPRPAPDATAGDVTGGYIFRMDMGEGGPGDRVPRDWVSPITSTVYSYHYPRYDDITRAQKDYLQEQVRRFEATMRGPAWNDPAAGYRQLLDVASWVDFALLQELSLNVDAYHKSIYLQKWPAARGNRIAIGPVWDFDLAFGTVEFRDARKTDTWAHTRNRFGAEPVPYDPPGQAPYVPEFWERLWADPAFQRDLRCRWQELRQDVLHLDSLNAAIEQWEADLAAPLERDAARWPDLPKSQYRDGIALLKTFLAARAAWMDANLPGTCPAR